MNPPLKQNKTIRGLLLLVVGLFIFWSVYQERKPQKSTGQMEFRMITGQNDRGFQIIMMETTDRFFVLDSAFRNSFEENDAEVVTRAEQLRLLSQYDDLQYRAGFSVGEEARKKQVRVSRELFNLLPFDHSITLLIDSKVKDSLLSISVIQ